MRLERCWSAGGRTRSSDPTAIVLDQGANTRRAERYEVSTKMLYAIFHQIGKKMKTYKFSEVLKSGRLTELFFLVFVVHHMFAET